MAQLHGEKEGTLAYLLIVSEVRSMSTETKDTEHASLIGVLGVITSVVIDQKGIPKQPPALNEAIDCFSDLYEETIASWSQEERRSDTSSKRTRTIGNRLTDARDTDTMKEIKMKPNLLPSMVCLWSDSRYNCLSPFSVKSWTLDRWDLFPFIVIVRGIAETLLAAKHTATQ